MNKLILGFFLLLTGTAYAQYPSNNPVVVPAQPDVLPPQAPLQSVNTSNQQINNNTRTTSATPAFSATPSYQPQQAQQVNPLMPYSTPANSTRVGY